MHLGKQFNLSDNGLRKICRKHAIPIPKMGYWQKLRYKKPTKRSPLPVSQNNEPIAINILPRIKDNVGPYNIIVQDTITVPEQIEKFHPLIEQTRKIFARKGHEYHGRSHAHRGENALDIGVSAEQLPRAYRIMDTIIKTLEQHGAKIGIAREDEWKRNTYAQIDDEKIRFELDELMSIVKKTTERFSFAEYEYIPKGKLVFRIKEYLGGCQSKWTEGVNSRLEDKLAAIINGIAFAAAYIKKARKDREEEHKQWEAAQKERERILHEQEEEKRRGQILEQQAASWQKSRSLRAFIRAAIKSKGPYAPDSQFARWVTWANSYAERLDPLKIQIKSAPQTD